MRNAILLWHLLNVSVGLALTFYVVYVGSTALVVLAMLGVMQALIASLLAGYAPA